MKTMQISQTDISSHYTENRTELILEHMMVDSDMACGNFYVNFLTSSLTLYT